MTLVALSGAYGAGGSRIGPALAERLEVPFLDRAIPAAVAEALAVPFDDAEAHDEQISGSWLERMLASFTGHDTAPMPAPSARTTAADFRAATQAVLLRQAATGRGVILGRAATIVLQRHASVLRARLNGPAARRIEQAMRLEAIDEPTARERQRQLDHAHATYAKHFYGVNIEDPSLYHLVLDSTTIDIDTCVDILVAAAHSLRDNR